MADPIALIRPTMLAGLLAAVMTVAMPTVVPAGCGINWTRTGGVWIATPNCPQQSPPSQPPPAPSGAPPSTP
jgi:hypothetical protein